MLSVWVTLVSDSEFTGFWSVPLVLLLNCIYSFNFSLLLCRILRAACKS